MYLTSVEQGYIFPDWANVVIGSTSDTGTLSLGAASWGVPVSFLSGNSGSINIAGTQTGTGSTTLSFTGPTTLGYAGTDAVTSNQAITFNSAVTLGADATVNSGTALTTFGSGIDRAASPDRGQQRRKRFLRREYRRRHPADKPERYRRRHARWQRNDRQRGDHLQ